MICPVYGCGAFLNGVLAKKQHEKVHPIQEEASEEETEE